MGCIQVNMVHIIYGVALRLALTETLMLLHRISGTAGSQCICYCVTSIHGGHYGLNPWGTVTATHMCAYGGPVDGTNKEHNWWQLLKIVM